MVYAGKSQRIMGAKTLTLILAANLKAMMEERGLSMAALSRLAGANSTAVHDIIHGRARSPKLETVEKLAAALDVTVDDLLREERRAEVERDLLSACQQLGPQDRKRLLETARAWLPPED